jgi:hypothetical protein
VEQLRPLPFPYPPTHSPPSRPRHATSGEHAAWYLASLEARDISPHVLTAAASTPPPPSPSSWGHIISGNISYVLSIPGSEAEGAFAETSCDLWRTHARLASCCLSDRRSLRRHSAVAACCEGPLSDLRLPDRTCFRLRICGRDRYVASSLQYRTCRHCGNRRNCWPMAARVVPLVTVTQKLSIYNFCQIPENLKSPSEKDTHTEDTDPEKSTRRKSPPPLICPLLTTRSRRCFPWSLSS